MQGPEWVYLLQGKLTEVQSYQPLIQTLATTMNYNPIQKLRNASTHALMVLLNSFQVYDLELPRATSSVLLEGYSGR